MDEDEYPDMEDYPKDINGDEDYNLIMKRALANKRHAAPA